MYTVRVKNDIPESIVRYKGTDNHQIYLGWLGHKVEPYGPVIPAYGNQAPHNRDCISVRLALPGAAVSTAVALDEFVEPLDMRRVPERPSYSGVGGIVTIDDALGY